MRLSGCCCRLHRISTLNSLTARMSHILHALSLTLWHNHMKPVSCSFFFALPFRFYFNLDSHCWRRAASACTVDRCLSLTYVRRRPLASSQASAQAGEENKKFSFILWVFANLVCISYLYEIHSRQIPQHAGMAKREMFGCEEDKGAAGRYYIPSTTFFLHFFLASSLVETWWELFNAAVNLIWIFSLDIAYFWYFVAGWCNMYSPRGHQITFKSKCSTR